MGHFVFIDYTGDDSGTVLARMLNGDSEEAEVVSETQRVIGFQPNPDSDDEEEQEDEEDAA